VNLGSVPFLDRPEVIAAIVNCIAVDEDTDHLYDTEDVHTEAPQDIILGAITLIVSSLLFSYSRVFLIL